MNKKLLYGLLGVGAIAGFYFWNKNKKSTTESLAVSMPKKSKEQIACENRKNHSWDGNGKTCMYNA